MYPQNQVKFISAPTFHRIIFEDSDHNLITQNKKNGFQSFYFVFSSRSIRRATSLFFHKQLQEKAFIAETYGTRGWSEKFSASTIDGNTIGKMFFPTLVYVS
jgi:hypothetical protein